MGNKDFQVSTTALTMSLGEEKNFSFWELYGTSIPNPP